MTSANPLALIRIVDDDPDMCASLEFLLSAAGWRSRAYSSAEEFLELDDPLLPGCLLLDVRMRRMSGLELQDELARSDYALPIIFITAHGDIDMAVKAVKKGAHEFLTKPIDDERLLKAVEQAVALDWRQRSEQTDRRRWVGRYAQLTQREREVAGWVATGLMNKVIADRLGVGEKTVQVHRGAVCRKLGVRSAVEIHRVLKALDVSIPEV